MISFPLLHEVSFWLTYLIICLQYQGRSGGHVCVFVSVFAHACLRVDVSVCAHAYLHEYVLGT